MAVYDIRLKADQRKHGKHCFVKEAEFLDIVTDISVRNLAVKIFFVIDEIISDPIQLIFQHSDIFVPDIGSTAHIKMCHIRKLAAEVPWNTGIIRDYHPDIPFLFVKCFRQCSADICQSPCFDKWHTL